MQARRSAVEARPGRGVDGIGAPCGSGQEPEESGSNPRAVGMRVGEDAAAGIAGGRGPHPGPSGCGCGPMGEKDFARRRSGNRWTARRGGRSAARSADGGRAVPWRISVERQRGADDPLGPAMGPCVQLVVDGRLLLSLMLANRQVAEKNCLVGGFCQE
jgi:hypothetical protein